MDDYRPLSYTRQAKLDNYANRGITFLTCFILVSYVMKFFDAGEISAIKRLWKSKEEKEVSDISDSI